MATTTDTGTTNTETTDNGLSRRRMMLIAGGAVAGASALLAAPVRDKIKNVARRVVAGAGGQAYLSLANGTYDEWLNEVGATFSLGGRTNLTLVGVRALLTAGAKPQGVRTQGFAAFFDPAGSLTVAPDLIYTATHTSYGPMQLFLASAGSASTPRRMVAVFS